MDKDRRRNRRSASKNDVELILASASPRRRELLSELGVPFQTIPAEVDENIDPVISPWEAAKHLAEKKARAVASRVRRGIVLGADTVVSIDGEAIGKPTDREDARRILARLSGARQAVITGVCLVDAKTGRELSDVETTWVTMRRMSADEIADYVASGEADDKAGAYAIQESGDRYVERVEGNLDNVVGLPMGLVRRLLSEIKKPAVDHS